MSRSSLLESELTYVVTLISDPKIAPITRAVIDAVRNALAEFGSRTGAPDWLSEGQACDLPLFDIVSDDFMPAIHLALDGAPIDTILQSSVHRRKKLLVADMDSTIIQQECIDEIAEFVGRRVEVSAITERAMDGEINFTEAIRARAAMFSGLDADTLDRAYHERITLTPGAETLVRVMRENGAVTALVSGGFTQFTSRVAKRTGFHHHHGNELEVTSGRLTGKVIEPIKGGKAKVEFLNDYCRKLDITCKLALAVGDGANDIPMIEAAGLGVSFHGKPRVAAAADAQIIYNDLTSLLFVQGYHETEIYG